MRGTATWTVLGSGTLLPSPEQLSAGHHLAVGGVSILLDCGSGTLHSLARHGIDWRGIDVIALSHYHTDHIGDLPALMAALRFEGRTRPLVLVGPEDVREVLDKMAGLYGPWILDGGYPLDVIPLRSDQRWRGPVEISALHVRHTATSVAYRVETPFGPVGYTGDTGPTERLGPWLEGCRVLVTECALSDPPEIDTHLSPQGVAHLLTESRPEVACLTHVYPPLTPEHAVREVERRLSQAELSGVTRVVPARDGLRLNIDAGAVW